MVATTTADNDDNNGTDVLDDDYCSIPFVWSPADNKRQWHSSCWNDGWDLQTQHGNK